MLVIIRIPVRFNDGTPIPEADQRRILRSFEIIFGGSTVSGPDAGSWRAPTGELYEEPMMRVEVFTERENLTAIHEHVLAIGRELQQKAMYFEVRGYDGVQFLTID